MKIRKTIQGSIPSNKVYNSHNVDKHNTYSTEYLNDKLVHVGKEEPINNEEIWVQAGKNLFDIRKMTTQSGSGATFTPDMTNNVIRVTGTPTGPYLYNLLLNFKPERKITIYLNGQQGSIQNVQCGVTVFDKSGNTIIDMEQCYNFDPSDYSNFDHMTIWLKRSSNIEMNSSIQVLISYTEDVTYEPYIDRKIYIRNKTNNTYEELYSNSGAIESGNNTKGYWIKFADGTMICHGIIDLGSVIYGTAYGSVYTASSSSVSQYFPTPFCNGCLPTVTLTANLSGGVGGGVLRSADNNLFKFYSYSVASATLQTYVSYIAIGRWK